MMYEIQSKSDFLAGATLTVRIPQGDLDQKALYTILADKPDFILPFRHRVVDGELEFTYQVGNRSKLTYLSGNRSLEEYSDLWVSILRPLIDCGDWFMTPYSFVLEPEYLFCDKSGKGMSFVYIPSIQACSDYGALKNMVTDIAKQNHVTDINLENKVVWAIQDFNPVEFLQMVKTYGLQPQKKPVSPKIQEHKPELPHVQTPEKQPDSSPAANPAPAGPKGFAGAEKGADDIAINISTGSKAPKKEKQKGGGFFGAKKEKATKPKPEPKEKGGRDGKKKQQHEIIQGAAATQGQVKSETGQPYLVEYPPPADPDDDVTQLEMSESEGAKLRYIGSGEHPKFIGVTLTEGGIFTIGRFDASVGTKQSSFEFDKRTKAVSRRHAVIERDTTGYSIADLSSAAGTYLNGQKLPPNAPFALERGCRVSFGHSGADYIWEE